MVAALLPRKAARLRASSAQQTWEERLGSARLPRPSCAQNSPSMLLEVLCLQILGPHLEARKPCPQTTATCVPALRLGTGRSSIPFTGTSTGHREPSTGQGPLTTAKHRALGTGHRAPGTGRRARIPSHSMAPGTRHRAPGSRHWAPTTWQAAPTTPRYREVGTGRWAPGTGHKARTTNEIRKRLLAQHLEVARIACAWPRCPASGSAPSPPAGQHRCRSCGDERCGYMAREPSA